MNRPSEPLQLRARQVAGAPALTVEVSALELATHVVLAAVRKETAELDLAVRIYGTLPRDGQILVLQSLCEKIVNFAHRSAQVGSDMESHFHDTARMFVKAVGRTSFSEATVVTWLSCARPDINVLAYNMREWLKLSHDDFDAAVGAIIAMVGWLFAPGITTDPVEQSIWDLCSAHDDVLRRAAATEWFRSG